MPQCTKICSRIAVMVRVPLVPYKLLLVFCKTTNFSLYYNLLNFALNHLRFCDKNKPICCKKFVTLTSFQVGWNLKKKKKILKKGIVFSSGILPSINLQLVHQPWAKTVKTFYLCGFWALHCVLYFCEWGLWFPCSWYLCFCCWLIDNMHSLVS